MGPVRLVVRDGITMAAIGACLAAVGCSPVPDPDPPPADSASEPVDSGAPSTVEGHLRAAGFELREGAFVFSTLDGCCGPGANCWGNNPSTPYGTPALPPSPGQLVEDHDILRSLGTLPDPGLSRSFRIRPDEAVLILGELPPAARYMSYRSYVGERLGAPAPVTGSLGPSLNHQVIAAQRGTSRIWGAPFALVTTAHAEVEARVTDALLQAGYAPEEIHYDRIPPGVGRPGIGADGDTFFGLLRVALYDDPEAGSAFQADPGYTVLRLTPERFTVPASPHLWPELPQRGTGQTEAAWAPAVRQLRDALEASWPELDVEHATAVPYWIETGVCTQTGWNCTGDIRDRFVALMPYFLLPDDETFVVLYGVNHERTGKATYASASVQTVLRQTGLESFASPAMPGSASTWLPHHPQADDLYAVVVARDCGPHPTPCIEVPSACPGPALDEPIKVTIRAYLEPETGAAPLPDELVVDQMLLFRPPERQREQ